MERLARRLRDLPVIRDAVRRGVITARKAEIISTVAKHNEAYWLIRAQAGTVRSLKAEARAERDPEGRAMGQPLHPGASREAAGARPGLALAEWCSKKPTASNSERVEAWCQEHMSTRQAPETSTSTT